MRFSGEIQSEVLSFEPSMSLALLLAAIGVTFWPERPVRLPELQRSAQPREKRTLGALSRRALLIAVALMAISALLMPNLLMGAAPISIGLGLLSRRLPIKPSAQDRARERQQLATICDLVGTCLAAGMATGAALSAVLDLMAPIGVADVRTRSPSVAALRSVAGLLALGADPQKAWEPVDSISSLVPIAAAARRSTVGGVGLAQAVHDQAIALAQEVSDHMEYRAGRAAVLMAAPLGLCFLPAFICLGLAPVIIALLADLGFGG